MADHITFVDSSVLSSNLVPAAWFNDTNNHVYQGKNPSFVTSTGSANAYTVTLPSSVLTTLATGQEITFVASFANTGAATLAVVGSSSTGAIAIQLNAAAIASGVIASGAIVKVVYSGSVWNIISNTTSILVSQSTIQAQTYTAYTTGGTLTAYSLTPSPAITANTENQRFAVEFHVASGASPTLSVSSQTAKSLKYRDSTGAKVAIAASTIPAEWRSDVVYDGTDWIVLDIPVAAGSAGAAAINLLTNPNWNIDQINAGALYTYSATTAVGPDGWSGSATGAGVFKLRTLADPDVASLKCLEITCTTADASLAATDNYYIHTMVEGYDALSLQAGLATAATISVQFKFKTTTTGVYGISVANSALNRSYVGIITVANTNENEYLVTLTMDTTGTWLYTNGVGLYLRISFAAGSNFCTTAGSWGANNMFSQTASQAAFMGVNTNIAYLKRIQLFAGSTLQPYSINIAQEVEKCQRYYCKTFSLETAPVQASLAGGALISYGIAASAGPSGNFVFPACMRAAPTIVTYNPTSANADWDNDSSASDSVAQIRGISATNAEIGASNSPATGTLTIHVSANARLT